MLFILKLKYKISFLIRKLTIKKVILLKMTVIRMEVINYFHVYNITEYLKCKLFQIT